MKILLFYDNFIRDYRSLLLLSEILKKFKHKTFLCPLWQNAIAKIKEINPHVVLMGQVGEFTTAEIGKFCHDHNINLAINTSEMVDYANVIQKFFSLNFKQSNCDLIDLQTIPNSCLYQTATNNTPSHHLHKYKQIGFPRFDLSSNKELQTIETKQIQKKYNIDQEKTVFLYVSSFIYDKEGGQISAENEDVLDAKKLIEYEQRLKHHHVNMLKKLIKNYLSNDKILLIKKHPWDKSDYFEKTFQDKACIILDNNEYIAPILSLTDFVLHSESTVALEAWVQKKKTIAILPHFTGDKSKLKNHMKHETIAINYKELINNIENYPSKQDGATYLQTFTPFLDGKATIRLAKEIDRLSPKPSQTIFKKSLRQNLGYLKWQLKELLTKPFTVKPQPQLSGYALHLYNMEKNKKEIQKMYLPVIKKYIKKNVDLC